MVLDLTSPEREGERVINILTVEEWEKMRRAGRVAAATLRAVCSQIVPGMSTAQIDRWVRQDTLARGGRPSQLGYKGFPAAVCTSRNQVVCHGIPSAHEYVADGDIINVDVTTELDGYHGDTSMTVLVGNVSPEARKVAEVARLCRDAGVASVRPGLRLGELGAVVEEVARAHGCSIVRDLGGHGIGRSMHQAPHVAHHAFRGGVRLQTGMAITIEPMVNLGKAQVDFLDDGWTVVTRDGSLSAQWEHTVLVTESGCEVLTSLE
ncbi:MAG TPA: type I methionyl aminopeptidase [Polyangiaceae bacterium]|nr:type I methionyl aminopeptidase [Polyangiaceae bacterium]